MVQETVQINDVTIPTFLYGTAWKEEKTQELTELAIESGFTGIDTANQRRHYYEEAGGKGITAAFEKGLTTREKLFLQTKFTSANGQDHRKPYSESDSLRSQVENVRLDGGRKGLRGRS